MSLRLWAIKRSELKGLDRAARIAFLRRCAVRVQPWVPRSAKKEFREGLALLTKPDPRPELEALADALQALGTKACNRLDGTPEEALGVCHNYATLTLAEGLRVSTQADMTAGILLIARYAGSIPATLAHAGLVKAPKGRDPVEFAATQMWDALREDLAACA